MKKKTVYVGMSGGVDSSVAAYLLLEQGYNVIGVTLQIWQDEEPEQVQNEGGCCGLTAVDDARRVCQHLDIPHYVFNMKKQFKEKVIDYFINEYKDGRTPNPCIACNRYIKWEAMLNRVLAVGGDFIATGHYALIEMNNENSRYTIKTSKSSQKDQSYALYNLTQHQLAHTLMPVGGYTKEEIRSIAKNIGLLVANKKDSQEICFVPDNDYGGFIKNEIGDLPCGSFVDTSGGKIGVHQGAFHYTIGQRKGLGAFGKPMFVKKIDINKNEITLCNNDELFITSLTADDINFMAIEKIDGQLRAKAKIRYSHKAADCTIEMDGERLKCYFDIPQRAITPGQAVVIYNEKEQVLCGGTISP